MFFLLNLYTGVVDNFDCKTIVVFFFNVKLRRICVNKMKPNEIINQVCVCLIPFKFDETLNIYDLEVHLKHWVTLC